MADRFKSLGIPVTLTRDSDITLSPTERTNKILSSYGDNPNVIVISNHLNAGGGTGAEVIYALRNNSTLADTILNNIGQTGQTTRKTFQKRLPSDNGKDYYFIHRNTGKTEPLIIEYGFIDDNKTNIEFLNNNYKELAEAVIKSVLNYKGIPYIPSQNNSNSTYTVKKGDTLYRIAKAYNTTISELKKINNLISDNLVIGQILKIKPTPLNDTYIVKKGDTLYNIATKYNTTTSKLKELNKLDNDNLSIGQILLLPSGEVIENTINTNDYYTVKPGDTLYGIARTYNISPNTLYDINNLNTTQVTVGQKLKIPTSKQSTSYIVRKGDTLYGIANKFNTTVDKIKELNNLKNNLLIIGQELLISK